MKKWLFRISVVVCISAGLMLSAFGFANSKGYRPSTVNPMSTGCGPTNTCESVGHVTAMCFSGCAHMRGCSSFATRSQACCLVYYFYCPIENRYSSIRTCNNSGICQSL